MWRARLRCHVRTTLRWARLVADDRFTWRDEQQVSAISPPHTAPQIPILWLLVNSYAEIWSESQPEPRYVWMRHSLQLCRLCDSVLGRMLARHLSFISAPWPESELREKERGRVGETEMREGSLPPGLSPIGQTQGLQSLTIGRYKKDGWRSGCLCVSQGEAWWWCRDDPMARSSSVTIDRK